MRVKFSAVIFIIIFMALGSCAQQKGTETAVHPVLQGTLWMQTSPEYQMVTREAYALAKIRLDEALRDKSWTAATEQNGNFGDLPPAVILDVDETVLDNSAFEARLVKTNSYFTRKNWTVWAKEAKAGVIPGALDFLKYAAGKGVRIFYVTNRSLIIKEATRKNLELKGFPVDESGDNVLTKNPDKGWGSDKSSRRSYVTKKYRVVLLFGDNLNDFITDNKKNGPEGRKLLAAKYKSYWGTRWIVLPNPMYGNWEGALYDFNYKLPRSEMVKRKIEALQTFQ